MNIFITKSRVLLFLFAFCSLSIICDDNYNPEKRYYRNDIFLKQQDHINTAAELDTSSKFCAKWGCINLGIAYILALYYQNTQIIPFPVTFITMTSYIAGTVLLCGAALQKSRSFFEHRYLRSLDEQLQSEKKSMHEPE